MREEWREIFELWSETDEYKEKVRDAEEIIKKVKDKAFVSFSGGKDSTALLHLVLKYKPNILVVHWDYGPYYIPRDLHKEIINIAKQLGAKNIRVLTSPLYRKLGRRAKNILGKYFIGKEIPKLRDEGYKIVFIGLRGEEAVKRKLRVKEGFEIDKSGIINCYPLRLWSWKDVWAYIISNNLPYLSFYDKYGELVGYDKVRFVTLFDPEFDKFGSMNVDKFLMWKKYKPD